MLDKNATDVLIIDLERLSSIATCFVIGTAHSEPQMKAVMEQIVSDLKLRDTRPWHTEGKGSWRWVLLDYVDVVIHIFREEVRSFYGLERLWGDAPQAAISMDPVTGQISYRRERGAPVEHMDVMEQEA